MNTCSKAGVDTRTVMAAVPLLPSLAAVIAAQPAVLPSTSPLGLTVATLASLLAHVTARPGSGWPLASSGVAVSWTVRPASPFGGGGITTTAATGDERPTWVDSAQVLEASGPPTSTLVEALTARQRSAPVPCASAASVARFVPLRASAAMLLRGNEIRRVVTAVPRPGLAGFVSVGYNGFAAAAPLPGASFRDATSPAARPLSRAA